MNNGIYKIKSRISGMYCARASQTIQENLWRVMNGERKSYRGWKRYV